MISFFSRELMMDPENIAEFAAMSQTDGRAPGLVEGFAFGVKLEQR